MHQTAAPPRRPEGWFRPQANEISNVITHGIGLGLAFPAVYLLLKHAKTSADFASCLVYGFTLLCVYAASTCLHAASGEKLRYRLEVLDHSAIYLLIGGTLTPYCVFVGGKLGLFLLLSEWTMALAGIAFKSLYGLHYQRISIASYLIMGWFPLLSARPILHATSWASVEWLIIGGIAYTLGVPFYLASRKRFPLHALWHIFVMLGSACHYIALWLAVA